MLTKFPYRMVFVTEEYPPIGGGVGISSRRVARNLAKAGCEVRLFTFDCSRSVFGPDYVLKEVDDTLKIMRFGPFMIFSPDRKKLKEADRAVLRRRAFEQMERAAVQFRPDIVLSFNAVNAAFLGTFLARSIGVPHITSVRGVDVGRNVFSFTELPILRHIVENSHKVACVNEHLKRRLLMAFPEAAAKCHVVYNSVELPPIATTNNFARYYPVEKWHGMVIAVFIGIPREKKGTRILLEAMRSIGPSKAIRLLIVGPAIAENDPYAGSIFTSLRDEGLVHATGFLPRAEALAVASKGDLIVMPSLEDGMANGLLEGIALGLAPIASDLFSDVIVHQESGWLAKKGSVDDLAKALLDAAVSPEKRSQYSSAAQNRLREKHAPEVETASYISLIAETLALETS